MPDISVNGAPVAVGPVRQIPSEALAAELKQAHQGGGESVAFRIDDRLYLAPLLSREHKHLVPGNAVSFDGGQGTVVAVDDEDNNMLLQRLALAAAESTPWETLTLLAADPDPAVRLEVAGNSRTPQDVIAALSADPDPRVREAAFIWR